MKIEQQRSYTTQLQAGLAMLQETRDLLRIYEPGVTASELSDMALKQNIFPRMTARRAHNVVTEMFAPRYLSNQGQPAIVLQQLMRKGMYPDDFNQLCFLYTARAQAIFGEFLAQVYWPLVDQGATTLERNLAEEFVRRGLDNGRMQKRWTDSTIRRVSAYILGCAVDFGLLQKSSAAKFPVARYPLRRTTAIFLAHELHFSGIANTQLADQPDWVYFGLNPSDARRLLTSGLLDADMISSSGSPLADLSWRHTNFTSFVHELA